MPQKLGNRRVQLQFLERLKGLLPPSVTPIIIADSGFRTPFFRGVESLGWHWLGRIRNRDSIAWADQPDNWLAAKSLYAKASRKPRRLWVLSIGSVVIRLKVNWWLFFSHRQRQETLERPISPI